MKTSIFSAILLLLLLFCSCSQTHTNAQNKIKQSGNLSKKESKSAGEQKMNGELIYPKVSKEVAQEQLQSYIFDIQYGRKVEPRNLDPKDVDEFIRKNLDRSKDPKSFGRTRMVIDFYDLTSILDLIENLLNQGEKDAKTFQQSVELVRILSEQGSSDQQRKAFDHYQKLVQKPLAEAEFEPLVEAISSFGGNFSEKLLLEEMNKTYSLLKERGKTDSFIDGQAEQLFTLMNSRLPQLLSHLKARTAISSAETQQKIVKLSELYLSQSNLASKELERWAARLLRSGAKNGNADAIINTMRKFFTEIENAGFEKEEKSAFQVRTIRTIRFFAGKLTEDEKEILKQGNSYQIDFLDRDFYEGDV